MLPVAKGASKAKPISLSRDSVRDAVLRVASPAGDDERYQRLVGAVGTSPSRQRVLFALADAPYGWVEKKSLKIALDEQARGLDSHLQQLADANVITRDKETRVRFVEPLIRAVARFARERGSVIAGEQPRQNG